MCADAVADFIDQVCADEIHNQLNQKIDCDQQRDLGKRNGIAFLKGDKQKRGEIIDDCLHDIADKAGVHGFAVIRFHKKAGSPYRLERRKVAERTSGSGAL